MFVLCPVMNRGLRGRGLRLQLLPRFLKPALIARRIHQVRCSAAREGWRRARQQRKDERNQSHATHLDCPLLPARTLFISRIRLSEQAFRKLWAIRQERPHPSQVHPPLEGGGFAMKKISVAFAALFALVVAMPSIASAETIVIKKGHHHHHMDRGWHHGWRHHHGWDRGHRHNTVVIKERVRSY
jgi:hypothetical protein